MSDDKPRLSLVPFTFAVWDAVVERIGPVSELARRARNSQVRRAFKAEMNPEQAALMVADQMTVERAALDWSMEAFGALESTVDFCADVVEGPVDKARAMRQLLEAKLAMAQLYHSLAKVGAGVDAPDMASEKETKQMVKESLAEIERFNAMLA